MTTNKLTIRNRDANIGKIPLISVKEYHKSDNILNQHVVVKSYPSYSMQNIEFIALEEGRSADSARAGDAV